MELKGKTKSILVTIFLAVLLAAKLSQSWRGHGAPERERSILFPEVSEVLKKLTLVTTGKPYVILTECRLITRRNSDGDSFHIQHEKEENEFWLHFVDAPESRSHECNGEWICPAAGVGRNRNPIGKNGERKLLPISLAHGGSSR